MVSFFPLLSTLSLLRGNVTQAENGVYPDPEPCTGNCTYVHDPSVIQRPTDGTFFRFSTNGNIAIASAPSMTGPWEYLGSMLPNGSEIQVTKGQEIWVSTLLLSLHWTFLGRKSF
jgi:arabinan endo-1,5-alpha-L-arabinosidase